ncbi:MAG: class I SAM-dependent RNA methyltransferase [Christensenellales bacterium]
MKIAVTTAFGIEAVTKRELLKLGYADTKAIEGKIELEGDYTCLAKLNVNLRTAERVLIKLAEFVATDFDTFYNEVKKIPFEDYLTPTHHILLDGNCKNSKLMAIKATGGVCKKAIIDRLKNYYKTDITESGYRAVVVFNIENDLVKVYLDSSGDGLHKRGYRTLSYTAPIKETIASAMILLSVYNKEKPFADLFCGSGTIAIECALIAKQIAPGLYRNFDFEHFKNFPQRAIDSVRAEAKRNILHDFKPNIIAKDINPEAIKIAKFHAKNAKVDNVIKFEVGDMKDFKSTDDFGVIISNPPYGYRIGNSCDAPSMYKDFNKMLNGLNNWSAYLLTNYKSVEKALNRHADKKRKLFNANIECTYYSFLGKKPDKKNNTN